MIWFFTIRAQIVIITILFFNFIQWWLNVIIKCDKNIIADDCENHSCEQCQAGNRLDHWSGGRGS